MKPLGAASLCLALLACNADTPMPGDQVLGSYSFTATPVLLDCAIDGVPQGGFSFTGTFSRDTATGEAWYRLNNIIREATFDGQVATAVYSAPRVFGAQDGGCTTELRESVVVGLMSKSMNEAAGDACPDHPLDGGMPSGPDITGPGSVEQGFDSVRACGELSDEIVGTPSGDGECDPAYGLCRLQYQLVGARR